MAKMASEKQVNFIKVLLKDRYFDEFEAGQFAYEMELNSGKRRGCTVDIQNPENMTISTASALISKLLASPKRKIA